MTLEEILERIKIYVDMYVDAANISDSIAHVDALAALDALEKEANREGFMKENHGKGTMQYL